MRRFLFTLMILLGLFFSWPFIEKKLQTTDFYPILDSLKSELQALKDNPEISTALETVNSSINELKGLLSEAAGLNSDKQLQTDEKQIEKPSLKVPIDQLFSIHNIELGDSKDEVEKQLGTPKRSSYNEYGSKWNTYHQDYQNFLMLSYDESKRVNGMYTNQDLIASSTGIKLGSPKDTVVNELGKPLEQMRKGLVYYQLPEDRDYDVFLLDNSYVTVFYDKHKNNTVTAIQMISEDLENDKQDFYTQSSEQLKEGFEYQLFDLTNADRVNHDLRILTWDNKVRQTARKHSFDMADNNYFSHTNLEGESPFDRMSEDGIVYTAAGENLASGQFSSIFAHEGLMNSLGHRENILRPEYEFLGVGVAFNEKSQPFYTENFVSK